MSVNDLHLLDILSLAVCKFVEVSFDEGREDVTKGRRMDRGEVSDFREGPDDLLGEKRARF